METKYNRVKQAIKSKILDGTFLPNQKISSESELMKQFGVSRHTVRLAIGDLVAKGWLYREQGAGTFCADRSLREKTRNNIATKNIAMITTYISDYIFPSIIRGADSYLSERDYHITLFSTKNDPGIEKDILEKVLSMNFEGVIVEPTKSAFSNPNINYYLNFERMKIPYIMINAFYDELEPLSIVVDDVRGGFLQAEHLIQLGHKRIAGFFKTDDLQGVKRMKGFVKAHRDYQVAIEPRHLVTYYTEEKHIKPLEELRMLLRSKERPTAVVCYNDELALYLLDVIREEKLSVPDDLSIIGYDDSQLAELSEIKLTSISHPKTELGQDAARMIIDMIESKLTKKSKDPIQSKVYAPQLVLRQSTREWSHS